MKRLISKSYLSSPFKLRSSAAMSTNSTRFFAANYTGGNNSDNQDPRPTEPRQLRQHNQVAAYKADARVNIIIKESASAKSNLREKEQFTQLLKDAAIGLHKNYKNDSQISKTRTEDFKVKIAKNFDGQTFALFIKHINELKKDVLDRNTALGIEHTPDSFLIFLDKIRCLTHSEALNEMILIKIASINMDSLKTKSLLNTYQKHSIDFKFEEKIRMGEIKKFAQDVIPQSRFIFDRYKVDDASEAEGVSEMKEQEPEQDYFSFFGSHEQAILRPESSFRNVSATFEFFLIIFLYSYTSL